VQVSALCMKLGAGANVLKRLIREPTVNRRVHVPTVRRLPIGDTADCQSALQQRFRVVFRP